MMPLFKDEPCVNLYFHHQSDWLPGGNEGRGVRVYVNNNLCFFFLPKYLQKVEIKKKNSNGDGKRMGYLKSFRQRLELLLFAYS